MSFPAARCGMVFPGVLLCVLCANLFAQVPFQFPTANHALFQPGGELKFFAPTATDKPWTSGSFGCVRDRGCRIMATTLSSDMSSKAWKFIRFTRT